MWLWGAVAALTIGMVGFGGPATAAPPPTSSAPAATASAAVDGAYVTITYTINRAAKPGHPTVTCSLVSDGATYTPDCSRGIPTKKLTTYGLTFIGLPDGDYEFTLTFTLSDGGTASATTQFTIDTLAASCEALGGVLVYNPDPDTGWSCGDHPGTPLGTAEEAAEAEALLLSWEAALQPHCPTILATHLEIEDDVLTYLAMTC